MEINKMELEPLANLEEATAQRLVEFLKYSEIDEATYEYNYISGFYEVQVGKKNFAKAQNLYNIFEENELDSVETDDEVADEPVSNADTTDEENIDSSIDLTLYENIDEKYKDNRSSAYTFIICGVAGLILLLLHDLQIITIFNVTGSSNIMFNIVIGILFVGFIAIGVYSFKYSSKLKKKAQYDDELLVKTIKELRELLSKEDIEASFDNSIAEELKYFNRVEKIKEVVNDKHNDIDSELIERIAEEYYHELYNL